MSQAPITSGRRLTTRLYTGRLSRSMLLVLLPIAILPVLIMGGVNYLRARSLLRDQVTAQLETLLHAQSEEIDHWVQRKHLRLDLAVRHSHFREAMHTILYRSGASAEELAAARQTALDTLRSATQRDAQLIFNQFLVASPEGVVLIASRPEWEGLDLNEVLNFRRLSGQSISRAVYAPAPLYEEQVVTFTARPFQGPSGMWAATVVGVSESFNLLSQLQGFPTSMMGTKAYFLTAEDLFLGIDPTRQELSALQPTEDHLQALSALPAMYLHGVSEHQHLAIELTSFNGAAVLGSYTWVPTIDLGLALEVPQSLVFGQMNSLTAFTVVLVAIAALLVGSVTWLGTRWLADPLLRLTETIRRFAEGDWSQRTTLERDDEVGLLAETFNQMADVLTVLYQSMEERVEERLRNLRLAASIGQAATAETTEQEILQQTVDLIVERLIHTQAAIYRVDELQGHAMMRAAAGLGAEERMKRAQRVGRDSRSLVGMVIAHQRPWVVSDGHVEGFEDRFDLIPGTRAEAALPITFGDQLLGVLDVHSGDPEAFQAENLDILLSLTNQIAAALQSIRLLETTQVDLRETSLLYRAGREIASAENANEIQNALSRTLRRSSYRTALYVAEGEGLRLVTGDNGDTRHARPPEWLPVAPGALSGPFSPDTPLMTVDDPEDPRLPAELREVAARMHAPYLAFFPVFITGQVEILIILSTHRENLVTASALQPYAGLVEITATALEKVHSQAQINQRLRELQSLNELSQTFAGRLDLSGLFEKIDAHIQELLDDVDFFIALYNEDTGHIEIPLAHEGGQRLEIDPFPLGDGLTSTVIRTRKPLLLVEDTERQARELGAWIVGKPAKSWLGVPLIAADEIVGVIAVQDPDREHRFSLADERLLTTISGQVAVQIRNARLLEETQRRALQLESVAEISRDISQTLDLDTLLHKAVHLVRDRFDFYHASIFLLDRWGQYAVVRQSTGEVGRQMMESGHRLEVGSQSIVGHVTAHAEPLVVNDVTQEPTHRPHPLLPDTRAELGIPLRVADRVLGALDVQSTRQFAFTPDDVQVLSLLADQLSVALVNAELFSEAQEHLAQHRLLHHVTTAAASSTSVKDALESAAQGLQATLTGDRVSVYLMDSDARFLELEAGAGIGEADARSIRLPTGEGVAGWVAAHRQALRLDDLQQDDRRLPGEHPPDTRAVLAVPLIYRGELLGVLKVESSQRAAYDETDQELLGTLGGTLAAIVANTRLIERQRLLFDVTSKIRRSVTMETVLETTVAELSNVLGARRASIEVGVDAKGAAPAAPEQEPSPEVG